MPLPSFTAGHLERLARLLADVVTQGNLGMFFREVGINETDASGPKWRRILVGLQAKQEQDRCGNNVAVFVQRVLDPALYTRKEGLFEDYRYQVNEVLAFSGLQLGSDGRVAAAQAAGTIDEARERAGRLRTELSRRRVHPDVLAFCRAELLQENHFHAVFEATKSLAQKIRDRTALTGDGTELVDRALGLRDPLLALNSLRTETERAEQSGVANLLKGTFGTFRNVTAHAPKVHWPMSEQDALDLLTIVSYLHRRLDAAVDVPRPAGAPPPIGSAP